MIIWRAHPTQHLLPGKKILPGSHHRGVFTSKTFIYPESHQEKCELPDTGEPATARLCALVQLSVKTGKLPPKKVGAPFCATLPLQAVLLDFTIPGLSCLSPELLHVVYFSLEISLPPPLFVSLSVLLIFFLFLLHASHPSVLSILTFSILSFQHSVGPCVLCILTTALSHSSLLLIMVQQ